MEKYVFFCIFCVNSISTKVITFKEIIFIYVKQFLSKYMTSLALYVIINLLIGHTLTGLFQKEIKQAERRGLKEKLFEKFLTGISSFLILYPLVSFQN